MTATVFVHPRILTAAHATPFAGAIAVENGNIVAIGSVEKCRKRAGKDAPVKELGGAILLPGFYDTHLHSGAMALQFQSPDVSETNSLAEAIDQLTQWQAEHPGTDWVVGGRWNANRWQAGESLHRRDLDEVFGDRPAALNTVDGHSVCLNTRALNELGYSDASEPLPGGVIERDENGQLTGVLRESDSDSARARVNELLLSDCAELLDQVQQHLHQFGVTAITDLDGEQVRDGYLQLAAEDRLRVRVRKGIPATALDRAIDEGRRTGDGDRWVVTGSVKFFSDGALGSHTALMHEPYEGDECNCGVEVVSSTDLAADVARANRNGIAVSTHAIGDRANTNVLDAYEANAELTREQGLRNSIEHAQHIIDSDLERFEQLNVIASMQPIHCTGDYPLSVTLLGDRATHHYPWHTLMERGVAVTFGSDAPIEPVAPLYGIHAAVTRQRRDGEPPQGREPSERISVADAINSYTGTAATAFGLGDRIGTLEEGKYADFVTLEADPFTCSPADLWRIRVQQTVVDGELVYELNEESN